jgi:hypothetical protein
MVFLSSLFNEFNFIDIRPELARYKEPVMFSIIGNAVQNAIPPAQSP